MGAASAAAVAGKARGPPLVLEIPRHLLDISPSRRAGGDLGDPRCSGSPGSGRYPNSGYPNSGYPNLIIEIQKHNIPECELAVRYYEVNL